MVRDLRICTDSGIVLRRRDNVEDFDGMWQCRELEIFERPLYSTVRLYDGISGQTDGRM